MPATIRKESVSLETFEESLENLALASTQPPKSRSQPILPLVTSICDYAYHNGIPTSPLISILKILTSANYLDQTSQTTIIRGLYPAERVPSRILYLIVNSLGQGRSKPASATQNLLLRWLILVQEELEEKTELQRLYAVLFNLLDVMGIRANLCHVLALLTERKHVKPFRIQMLLALSRSFGIEPALLGLLRVYKVYYPDVIIGQPGTGRIARFDYPDPAWQDRLRVLQEQNLDSHKTAISQNSAFKAARRGTQRSGASILPEVHTYRADESSTTIEEVDGVDDFIENLDRIELPNQMVSALDDALLQNYVVLRNSPQDRRRIDLWLSLFFDAQLSAKEDSHVASTVLVDLLEKVLAYSRYTKILPESVVQFLAQYVTLWDGRDHQPLVLDLLSYLPFQPFEDLQTSTLNNLEMAILDNTAESAAVLLSFYTALLRRWTVHLMCETQPSPAQSTGPTTYLDSLSAHASLLSLTLLTSYPTTLNSITVTLAYHSALTHTISHAPTTHNIRILTPLPLSVYLLAFLAPSAAVLSTLASLLATYKLTFEASMVSPLHPPPREYPRDYVNAFNGFLMDICNLLWRSRAFNTTDTNALGCLLPAPVTASLRAYVERLSPPQVLQTLFSLSHNPALVGLSIAALRDLEDRSVETEMETRISVRHAGPVTQRSLAALAADGGIRIGWAEYRLEVLNWLGDVGVHGVGELMFCTMKHLMGQKAAGDGVARG